jgi:hypothetical protein
MSHFASLAQQEERRSSKPNVTGSSPVGCDLIFYFKGLVMISNIKIGDLVYIKRKINSVTSKFICTVLSINKSDNYYKFRNLEDISIVLV